MTNIVPYSDIERMAVAVAKSQLFGMKTPEQAIALMLVAQSENLHPARAAMEYHVINGRPALKADAMLARFQSAGGKVEWKDYTDEKVSGVFSHPQGGSVTIDWTIDRAKQAGVYGKNPTWKSYPRAMLRSRCISEGIRTVYPGVSVGIYTPEEVQDFAEKDVTPAPASDPTAKPAPAPDAIKAKAAAMKADSAKAAKVQKPVAAVIEGEYSVTGDLSEGDLSGIGEPQKPPYPADVFAKNIARWRAEGTKTPEEFAALLSAKGVLSQAQHDDIARGKDPIATQAELGVIINEYANIGYTIEEMEAEYGKPIDEWKLSDIAEAKTVHAVKAAERKAMLAQIAAEKAAAAETVI